MSLFKPPAFAHGDRLEAAGHVVRLAINPRARRVSLRIDRTRREVIATAPTARRLAEAVAFARDRMDWIAQQMAGLPEATLIHPGLTVSLFGEAFDCIAAPGRARLDPEARQIRAPDDAAYADRVLRLIKGHAQRRFLELTQGYCEKLSTPTPRVSVVDPKARWGSCSPARPAVGASIRYSWRLALAPFEVADYVAAHECAHLIEANHGPRFWALVSRTFGDPAPHRDWLKVHGIALHAFGR
ncbi:MAG: M48 family peptidase [Caulobacteraceae bacterium]|nr:M48 family peptidase [Caulobacteraceae bacterium]